MPRIKHSSVGMVWKLGGLVPAQVSSSSLNHGSKFSLSIARSPQVADWGDVNIYSRTQAFLKYRSLSWHYFPRWRPIEQLSRDLFSVWFGNSSKRSSSKAEIRRMGPKRVCRCSRFS
ncbi:hypothetical protein TNCV_617451 [Trichonephila clavipes]|nr:hypothetical protein TNCV_617451 [Trichonephila clavipes]